MTHAQPRPARILVADDEPEILEVLHEVLSDQGYEVLTAATGAEALAAVPNFRPDVCLVDIAMPGLSGAEVLDAFRRSGSAVPVIAISGHPGAVGEGFFAVLAKPFAIPTIERTVAAAVGESGASDG
jgi:CheY-like chemotaxis protein